MADPGIHPRWSKKPLTAREARQEAEATDFALALLMPRDWLLRDVQEKGATVGTLAKRYAVSEAAMTVRLVQIGLAVPL